VSEINDPQTRVNDAPAPGETIPAIAVLFLLACLATSSRAEEAPFSFPAKFSGVLDLRYAHTNQPRSWLKGGPGKLRYGGADIDGNASGDRQAHRFAVSHASLLMDAKVPPGADIHVQANLNADPNDDQENIALVEAYGAFHFTWEDEDFDVQAGAFIPPLSWEHGHRAWSTSYSLTPSAMWSWVGEDVRTQGAQGTWEHSLGEHRLRLRGALFTGGDQTGRILLYRGWALHDYQSGLNTSLPLPASFGLPASRPFKELDGRMGLYGRLEFDAADVLKLRGGYWDNNGDINANTSSPAGGAEEVWNTQFWDFGSKFEWAGVTAIAHYMKGYSASPSCPRWEWSSWYFTAAYALGDWSVSGRFDRFGVNQRKWENGQALTFNLHRQIGPKMRLGLEYIRVDSRPAAPLRPGFSRDQNVSLNYRFIWG
jgi:hypothetical protein